MATATQIPATRSQDPTERPRMNQYDSPHEGDAEHSLRDVPSSLSSASSDKPLLPSAVSSTSSIDLTSEKPPRRRSSVFFEEGLKGEDAIVDARVRRLSRPSLRVRFRSKTDIFERPADADDIPIPVNEMPALFPTFQRLLFFVLVLVVFVPSFGGSSFFKAGITPIGAKAGVVRVPIEKQTKALPAVQKRQDTSTDTCKRWSGQSAVVNGTMYYYGGRASTSADQTQNEWNNDFLALDLTKTWQISTPSLTGLPKPSGVPAVSLGYLWNDYNNLYLYGGQFSDSPAESPAPFSVWQYDIAGSSWTELDNDETAGGENAEASGQTVQRAAEGAGITIPSLGRGYYFGGHLDGYTVEGWSQSVARVYLTSLLEYTFPGYSNKAVNNGAAAGSGGQFRNITKGGVQGSAGFPERADGTLVYIPGYGAEGILLGLAGGNNATFTQLNIIDVYDIATSSWYRQATSGPSPKVRVNPCAVVASSADGSSTNMYMFGGQDLKEGSQTQYNDMWILSVPSFTWIEVDMSEQSVPPARAGHLCAAWNSQMIVWGGVGSELSCDSPGIYVFNMSSLAWQNQYTALEGGMDDKLNRQTAQDDDAGALEGSYGYGVPGQVQSVIGGNAVGAATVTEPVQTPTAGPMATGEPKTYTITGADGSVATETTVPGSGAGPVSSGGSSSSSNAGAIAGGVIAGVLFIIALYLGWCVYVYRKQLKVYKNHVAMAQRQHLTGDTSGSAGAGFLAIPTSAGKSSKEKSLTSSSYGNRTSDERSSQHRGAYAAMAHNRGTSDNSVPPLPLREPQYSSDDDVILAQEPSFVGILLNPRRSLRVVNRD
ncbi:uncharacterized protein AB675_4371 [Cyphellophora attinorum]|uniref:Kelch repeat-containing protein n=1 Tax=Cyphellophora attinorum TaxID=1664694 RepID=A0A0N0NJG6_9EURO|nr:uncharacterized protein AB675_4371 [Phialophora attinorum]KPI36609.1 hypothetical protein AB675_4371 [Phialophora attinorum]